MQGGSSFYQGGELLLNANFKLIAAVVPIGLIMLDINLPHGSLYCMYIYVLLVEAYIPVEGIFGGLSK